MGAISNLFSALVLASTAPVSIPTDVECRPLPKLTSPFSFSRGEFLEFDLDALGAVAGQMSMRTLTPKDGTLPVEIRVQTNTFFSKIRRVKGVAQSYLHPQTLRPRRYFEETVENEVPKSAHVTFLSGNSAKLKYSVDTRKGESVLKYSNEGLDVAGAIYLLRQLPFKEKLPLCFDAYGIRRMWRVFGEVVGKEKVSLPLGEFEAWHIAGQAVRLDDHKARREIHVWISADARRLPLAALGTIDLGAVRATLKAFNRPGDKKLKAQGKETLKW